MKDRDRLDREEAVDTLLSYGEHCTTIPKRPGAVIDRLPDRIREILKKLTAADFWRREG